MGSKYHFSTISRRETGQLKVDQEYLQDFSNALGLSEEKRQELSFSIQVNSLRPKSNLLEAAAAWSQIVLAAKDYVCYFPYTLSIYLQVLEYTTAALESHGGAPDPVSFSKTRIAEAQKALQQPDKRFRLLSHENALYYPVGSPQVMLQQLEALLHFTDEPNIEFRLLPREEFSQAMINFGFEIIDQSYCVCENRLDVSITDDPPKVQRFRDDFDSLWHRAVIGKRRNEIIERAMDYYKEMAKQLSKQKKRA